MCVCVVCVTVCLQYVCVTVCVSVCVIMYLISYLKCVHGYLWMGAHAISDRSMCSAFKTETKYRVCHTNRSCGKRADVKLMRVVATQA